MLRCDLNNHSKTAMRAQRTIEILEALVGFDTTSRNSNLALVEWVEAYLDRFGVPHERITDETGTKANVWATIGPPGVPGTILSGHTDVVPIDGQSWSNDPFRLTERDGRTLRPRRDRHERLRRLQSGGGAGHGRSAARAPYPPRALLR